MQPLGGLQGNLRFQHNPICIYVVPPCVTRVPLVYFPSVYLEKLLEDIFGFALVWLSGFCGRGKAENKDKMKTRIAEKGVFKKKSNLDADTVKSYKKRIKYMKDRKAKGKNFSAKNLKELEAKLAAN